MIYNEENDDDDFDDVDGLRIKGKTINELIELNEFIELNEEMHIKGGIISVFDINILNFAD